MIRQPWRPAMVGLGEKLPAWVSELAEELAFVLEGVNAGPHAAATISQRIREVAAEQKLDPWIVTDLVAREWDRLGIRRVPRGHAVGGW